MPIPGSDKGQSPRRISKLRPSPAMVVALIALFVAMGGVSYAAARIGSAQIKNNSVRGKDIRNSTITGTDVKNNTLTGGDVSESTLGTVPSATSAGSANPVGPAGGALTGSYPNPTIGPNTINGARVADDSLTGADVNESTLGTVPNAAALGGRPPSSFLAASVYTRESAGGNPGTAKGDGTFVISQACDPGDTVLSGGPADLLATTDLIESFPTPGNTTNSWSVRINPNGVGDNFKVVVNCVDQQ